MENDQISVVAFDADDTLWENENHFKRCEARFCQLLSRYGTQEEISQRLFESEMKTLHLYGYGVKAMILSMIETACEVTGEKGGMQMVNEIVGMGLELLQHPVIVIDGVEEVLKQLSKKYRLVLATKGDLLDQKRKVEHSGLKPYFDHIEIMSDKQIDDYRRLLNRLDCAPDRFMMVGNSLKSDILPVLELGGHAVHVPFHTTWQHEHHDEEVNHDRFRQLSQIKEILNSFPSIAR